MNESTLIQNWINAKLVDTAYCFTEDYCMDGELNYFLLEYFKKEIPLNMTERKFSITFLTQEEPESGRTEDREILSACPSTGSMEIFSDANSYGELLQYIKGLFQKHADSELLAMCRFADEQTIAKYLETNAKS
jgi:hypothetical protein